MPEKKVLIVPLPKSPWDEGRIGIKKKQDWYRSCMKALEILCEYSIAGDCPTILIASGFENKQTGYVEVDFYLDIFEKLLKCVDINGYYSVDSVAKGSETISQLDEVFKYADAEKFNEVIIISSRLHWPRVKYLCKYGKKKGMYKVPYTNEFVYGIPRPREAVTDSILNLLMPIIDWLGLREFFLKKT